MESCTGVFAIGRRLVIRGIGSHTVRQRKHPKSFHSSSKWGRSNAEAAFKGLEGDFPCLLKNPSSGPEPKYDRIVSGYKEWTSEKPFYFKYGTGQIPSINIAYETWGDLNAARDNAVVVHSGLSASSHAKSHPANKREGWWERFIGPGAAVDTNKFYVICMNTLGGCYGSTGPSSVNPVSGERYGTSFPILSVNDIVNAQFELLDSLGVDRLYASVGSSLGGMCSLLSSVMYPERVGRMVSISACAKSHPTSIAMRYLQRKSIMIDPHWNRGHYYGQAYPRNGMKLARELATMTYRSGPEWGMRFGQKRIEAEALSDLPPTLCPTFLIESYLDYQGEAFCTKFDPNSLLYISKAMDLFDVSEDYEGDMKKALSRVTCPSMILGAKSDILFPIWQQREIAEQLVESGNKHTTFYELNSLYGHDTFLLDLNSVGGAVKGFLETDLKDNGKPKVK